RTISSNILGTVLSIDENSIGKVLTKEPYIKMDIELNLKELKSLKDKIEYLRETVVNSEKILKNLKLSLDKKRVNYQRISNLSIKSVVEKDAEFHNLINSENNYLNTKKEINNLKIQITDLKYRREQVQRTVEDKNLVAEGFVLYSISVKVGQVVNVTTPLAQLADISKGKLTIFLDDRDLLEAKNRVIYINDEKTEYKIDRVLYIADSKNISKYMAQIIIDSPKLFSKLVQVELRDE
ncbi:MAG: HlyD family secretion protein, partial [Campylobacterota bacterium]|nr:HlyD family secretion protein [Campylobacterota bacterium]